MLPCVAECCSVLQCVAVRTTTSYGDFLRGMGDGAVYFSVLQCVACVAVCSSILGRWWEMLVGGVEVRNRKVWWSVGGGYKGAGGGGWKGG